MFILPSLVQCVSGAVNVKHFASRCTIISVLVYFSSALQKKSCTIERTSSPLALFFGPQSVIFSFQIHLHRNGNHSDPYLGRE